MKLPLGCLACPSLNVPGFLSAAQHQRHRRRSGVSYIGDDAAVEAAACLDQHRIRMREDQLPGACQQVQLRSPTAWAQITWACSKAWRKRIPAASGPCSQELLFGSLGVLNVAHLVLGGQGDLQNGRHVRIFIVVLDLLALQTPALVSQRARKLSAHGLASLQLLSQTMLLNLGALHLCGLHQLAHTRRWVLSRPLRP